MKTHPGLNKRRNNIGSLFLFLSAALILLSMVHSAGAQSSMTLGEISVSSVPEGATIHLDGILLPNTTNTLISNVYPGIHTVRLEYPGYQSWEKIIDVESGKTTFVFYELDQKTGTLVIDTLPEGADIYLDDEYYGRTDTILNDIPEGEHMLHLVLSGYADRYGIVRIQDGYSSSFTHTFEIAPESGSYQIYSVPAGARILIDGREHGITNRVVDLLSPGTHTLNLKLTGYEDYKTDIIVATGETGVINAQLTPVKTGVFIITGPESAEIYIDGVLEGVSPAYISLNPGSHSLSLRLYAYLTINTEITAGYGVNNLTYNLVPAAPSAIETAEAEIEANSDYNQQSALAELETAKWLWDEGDFTGAYAAAERAAMNARDIDGDGIPNILDLQPEVKNDYLYTIFFLLLCIIPAAFVYDWIRCNARPSIILETRQTEEGEIFLDTRITVSRPFYAMIATLSLDGKPEEYYTRPGRHSFLLGTPGQTEHIVKSEVVIEKKRYGKKKISQEITLSFTRESPTESS